jgi:hypothetical protein
VAKLATAKTVAGVERERALQVRALRRADGVVAVSEYVARYTRQWGGMDAVHVPISLLEAGDYPPVGRFENRFVRADESVNRAEEIIERAFDVGIGGDGRIC